jgi:phosphocarrier protein HPr
MSETKASRTVTVASPDGLHVRAASLIAKLTGEVPTARVQLVKGNHRVDATNVLQMLSLCALEGEQLLLEATGQDADAALDLLARLFENEFSEDSFGTNEPTEQYQHRASETPPPDVASDDNRLAR